MPLPSRATELFVRSESPYLPIRHYLTHQSRSDHSFSNGIQQLKPEKAEKLTQKPLKK
jgi:hypothetical protein